MPYRDAIDTVLARCDELCERIERLQHVPVERRTCETVAEALAWETRLAAHAARLESHRHADDELPAVTDVAGSPVEEPIQLPSLALVMSCVIVCATVVIGVLQFAPKESHPAPPKFALMAADVVSAEHHGDRCSVRVDRSDDGACDVDIICPSVEKRFRKSPCPPAYDLGVGHRYVSFTTDDGTSVDLELDAWR